VGKSRLVGFYLCGVGLLVVVSGFDPTPDPDAPPDPPWRIIYGLPNTLIGLVIAFFSYRLARTGIKIKDINH
jgi:hypothetical protein